MNGTALVCEEAEDLFQELCRGACKPKERMAVFCLICSRTWCRAQAQVERESKRTADSDDTSNNVGTLDGAAIPCICNSVSGFDPNVDSATILSCDTHSLIEEMVGMLDADSLMITSGCDVKLDAELRTNFFK